MFIVVARVMLVIVFFVNYSSIILIIKRHKHCIRQNNSSTQTRSRHTLVFCCSIVSVFVYFTTLFVEVFVTDQSSPEWSIKFATMMFPLNQIFNSIIYLLRRYRKTRPRNDTSKEKKQIKDQAITNCFKRDQTKTT